MVSAGDSMNRRCFLSSLGALVGGLAIDQAIPLGKVWSFPSKIERIPVTLRFHRDAFVVIHNPFLERINALYGFDQSELIDLQVQRALDVRFLTGARWEQ